MDYEDDIQVILCVFMFDIYQIVLQVWIKINLSKKCIFMFLALF